MDDFLTGSSTRGFPWRSVGSLPVTSVDLQSKSSSRCTNRQWFSSSDSSKELIYRASWECGETRANSVSWSSRNRATRYVFHERKSTRCFRIRRKSLFVLRNGRRCLKVKGEGRFAFFFCSIGLRAKRRRSDDRDSLEIEPYATCFLSIRVNNDASMLESPSSKSISRGSA